ncbi:hypothetical protein IV494_00015 [Kaistella sp. G5-32]|uniref:Uncharacterized protein n=1 Tax=Kaistella gelatinilytica TaxID=2787636 RepID=A0ABS0F798_9FLAO|nr:hypothetical protein [Kaistella gelatinilytica]MBF8455552.1 hypothetical protein [Kaistella gelatinilytica]
MRKLIPLIFIILIVGKSQFFAQSTKSKDAFNEIVNDVEGDLNKDNLPDKIIAATNNTDEIRPFRFQIFISRPNTKKLKLVVSTTKLFESQYPYEKGREERNFRIPDFFIENGKLTILTDVKELHSRYIFRFKDGNFELTNISRVIRVGNETTTQTEINLLSGSKEVYDEDFSPGRKYKIKQKTKPKTLPKIQDLTFSDLERY